MPVWSIYRKFVRRFVAASAALKVGDPANPRTVVGPMIDRKAATASNPGSGKPRRREPTPCSGGGGGETCSGPPFSPR